MFMVRITIPKAVFEEVSVKSDSGCIQIKENLDWIIVEEINDICDRKMYKAKLHAGEVDVVIQAQSDPRADLVVIDDNTARVMCGGIWFDTTTFVWALACYANWNFFQLVYTCFGCSVPVWNLPPFHIHRVILLINKVRHLHKFISFTL